MPTSPPIFPHIVDAGDSGMMVMFGDVISDSINNAAHAFDHALNQASWAGVEELIPAIRGVLVKFDPLQLSRNQLRTLLESLLGEQDWLKAPANPNRKLWRLPAHYGEESGPDIDSVAATMGISKYEVIRQHSTTRTRVLMLGFTPGCAYLGSLPSHWDLPRLDYVKPEVPPGSLSVAVSQTVLFAIAAPTGWQTIGRTPFLSFSRNQKPYFYLAPGDEILFAPIDHKEFLSLYKDSSQGKQIVTAENAE
ncbi:MAG: allophanate hydrolase subunit 1 [Granulosicoccus sp.]|nr:allophanate hydrolase subunit 1 [Granulosicoccus sp.]